MLSVVMAFLAVGAIIIIGFISNLLFNKSKVPDVLILIALGYLIGPGMLGIIDNDMFEIIEIMAPMLAAVALAMIMFDGGLGLNYDQVLGSLTRTMLHTIVAFSLSIMVTTAIAYMMMGWDFSTSLLIGAILGGTSGAVVIPLVNRLKVSPKTRVLLTIESALTDVIVIVMAMSIILLIQNNTGDLGPTIQGLAASFFVSFMIGLIFGIFWLRVLAKLEGQPFSYMVTLAVLFIIYALTDILVGQSGVGAIAALIFGLVLGNKEEFARIFKKFKGEFRFNEEIRQFHSEISFFVRTFFFVYLGVVVQCDTCRHELHRAGAGHLPRPDRDTVHHRLGHIVRVQAYQTQQDGRLLHDASWPQRGCPGINPAYNGCGEPTGGERILKR
jgi:potassium/hydrogen antiporter